MDVPATAAGILTAQALRLDGVAKSFNGVVAVKPLSLAIAPGELVALLGPSGCGKTTTLRMVAGFETPDAGKIHIGERDVTRLAPHKRRIGMVFQSYALFPHMTVRAEHRVRAAHAARRWAGTETPG